MRLETNGAIIFEGFPGKKITSSEETSFLSTLDGSQSPGHDSGVSLGHSPGRQIDYSKNITAKGKKPMDNRRDLKVSRKRPRRGSSSSVAEMYHTEAPVEMPSSFGNSSSEKSQDLASSTHVCQHASIGLPTHRSDTNNPGDINILENLSDYHLHADDHKVGWICALQIELEAAQGMLDKVHARGFGHGTDCNLYILGHVGHCNVVLTCLPKGQYGNTTAAMVATRMMNRFPKIDIGLMVGIGGGLPSAKNDIRLGDVVVSTPDLQYGGVVQYDMGKFTNGGFVPTGSLQAPPEKLLQVLNLMPAHGSPLKTRPKAQYPGAELDSLYKTPFTHVENATTCESCDEQQIIHRKAKRDDTTPHVFYGTIASGNAVIRNSEIREILIQKHGVMCCEMEAAGLMNTKFPCLVIRGISDYADSHKNDIWMKYAAAAAANYTRDLLCAMPRNIVLSI